MGKELLELFSKIKDEISHESTLRLGFENLVLLRERLFDTLLQFKKKL